MQTLVLTFIGTDRAGLVSAVSGAVSAHGGTWQRSELAHLAGTFAGIAEVAVPADRVDSLLVQIEGLSAQGLRVTVEQAAGSVHASRARFTLSLLGADRPGILAEVSALLAAHRINVEELSTEVVEAPMAGDRLFKADAVVGVPDEADVGALRTALEALADELIVDVALTEQD